ncbi:mannitol-1-phosphate 5-dehydrogenase [Orbus sturtevantii]|uniref:mannitol-1-phosphate 5-dehydrogenase n=1 Tax=Orbus sturtevantii TaxID=3074109 RepID=UPI00370D8BAB
MQVLHFGAGNIGKGFIANVLSHNGFSVCFVDVDKTNIEAIRRDNKYQIEILELSPKRLEIDNVFILDGLNEQQQIIDKIIAVDLITTSVGVNNLVTIAPIIIKGLVHRFERQNRPINIIANENAINATNILKKIIIEHLSKEHSEILPNIGFVNSAIDRQAITQGEAGHAITAVEPFWEWVINQKELVDNHLPKIVNVTYVDDLQPYIEKKLYIVNLGHATLAYLGFVANKSTILETLSIKVFRDFTQRVMQDSAKYLTEEYDFTQDYLFEYIENTLDRFANPHLQDSVLRVAKSPIRKLSANERLIGPLSQLNNRHLPINNLAKVIAMALLFKAPQDSESLELQHFIEQYGVEKTICHYCQINDIKVISIIKHYYMLFLLTTQKATEHNLDTQIEQILLNE